MPRIVVIGGPNGAGKSTTAPALLRDLLGILNFVDADQIARGLAGFDPAGASFEAGRIMLERIRELARTGDDFAFETTLASRTFAPWLRQQQERGVLVHLLYLWLPGPDQAVARVADRVKLGGHNVDERIVRRRYGRSVRNLRELYLPLADIWQVYDNSAGNPLLVAERCSAEPVVHIPNTWRTIMEHRE